MKKSLLPLWRKPAILKASKPKKPQPGPALHPPCLQLPWRLGLGCSQPGPRAPRLQSTSSSTRAAGTLRQRGASDALLPLTSPGAGAPPLLPMQGEYLATPSTFAVSLQPVSAELRESMLIFLFTLAAFPCPLYCLPSLRSLHVHIKRNWMDFGFVVKRKYVRCLPLHDAQR